MSENIFNLTKFENAEITDAMLEKAALLFSNEYGVWGAAAENNTEPSCRPGNRIKMSTERLREQCLSNAGEDSSVRHVYVSATNQRGIMAGHVFATRWDYVGRSVCWITQLVVAREFRRQRLATGLLQAVCRGQSDCGYGILSSHPFAILAALRAFAGGIKHFDIALTRDHARRIMSCSPVKYVREAELKGSLFENEQSSCNGAIACADTGFFIDHQESQEALEILSKKGIAWPLGSLSDGHEFVLLIDKKPRSPELKGIEKLLA